MAIENLSTIPMPNVAVAIIDKDGRLTPEGFKYLQQLEQITKSYNSLLAALRAASISGV